MVDAESKCVERIVLSKEKSFVKSGSSVLVTSNRIENRTLAVYIWNSWLFQKDASIPKHSIPSKQLVTYSNVLGQVDVSSKSLLLKEN
jgi:hypothetical protein